jgi:hypothetical protein
MPRRWYLAIACTTLAAGCPSRERSAGDPADATIVADDANIASSADAAKTAAITPDAAMLAPHPIVTPKYEHADVGPPLAGPCAKGFPSGRLDALAKDKSALRPWGALQIDADAKVAIELPSTGAGADVDAIATANGFALPTAYAELLGRFDGADVMKTHRFAWIGTDGSDFEIVIDVDDWFGKGRCAVLGVDEGSSDVIFVAADLPGALERVIHQTKAWQDDPRLARPRPPK